MDVEQKEDRNASEKDAATPWDLRRPGGAPPIRLEGKDVGVWRASLEPGGEWLGRFWSILSSDELERAGRFRFEEHRRRFVAARGILRHLVAASIGEKPEDVQFRYGAHGKPFVDGPVSFNMSDSGSAAVYAIGIGREIGIDIEQVRAIRDVGALASRFFAPREAETVLRSHPNQQDAFFTCWTRKEAYIKARGEGLSRPLHSFEVSIEPEETPRLVSSAIDPGEVARWSMSAFSPFPGYVAAIVFEGDARLCHYAVRLDP